MNPLGPLEFSSARILILSLHYKPEQNFIVTDIAERLAQRAMVTVITAHPNYPSGRFYSGEKFPRISKSVEGGVVVWRLPYFPDHSLSIIRRLASYLSFAIITSFVAPFVCESPDIVWVYHGPFTTGLAALYFKFFKRSRLIITCADLWPESFAASGVVRSSWILKLARAYNRALNKAADLIVCSTRGIKQSFREIGIPDARLTVVPVWIEGTRAVSEQKLEALPSSTIVYTGNLGPAQRLDTVIRGAAAIQTDAPHLTFEFYGAGASEADLRELATRCGASNVRFHGRVSSAEAFEAAASSLAQIVSLQRSPLFRRTVPSKLFSAFAASTPILYGLEGEAGDLAQESGGGIPFKSDDPATFVSAVKKLLALSPGEIARMRQNLNQFFTNAYDPNVLLGEYEAIFARAIPRRGPSEPTDALVA